LFFSHRSVSPIKKDQHQQRRLSVSSVSSVDKRANKVYEKWPDYNQISEIVGYRIDPPPSKVITTDSSISAHPTDVITQRKRNKSTGFPTASKQVKNVISLNRSSKQRESPKLKKSKKPDITPPVVIDKPAPTIEKVPIQIPIKEHKPKLPNILCPSSMTYSNRVQTRQWLIKYHFSSNAIRTLPLL
jgi:hypothetical protein